MARDQQISVSQAICDHSKHRHYTQREFDILKGFEIVETKCLNCHKILVLNVGKIGACTTCKIE